MNGLLIFFGGGAGALLRHVVGLFVSHHVKSHTFPYHTLCVNLAGAFLIGALAEFFALRTAWPEAVRFLLVTGFLGGFTTFSAFSLETALMLERGDYLPCAAYIAASVAGGIALVFAGTVAMRAAL